MTEPDEGAVAARGRLRASHADREQVIDTVKTAFADGRLDEDELDARVGQALAARTYAELATATVGIPAAPAQAPPPRRPTRPPVNKEAGLLPVVAVLLPDRVEIGRPQVGEFGQEVIARLEALGGDPAVGQPGKPGAEDVIGQGAAVGVCGRLGAVVAQDWVLIGWSGTTTSPTVFHKPERLAWHPWSPWSAPASALMHRRSTRSGRPRLWPWCFQPWTDRGEAQAVPGLRLRIASFLRPLPQPDLPRGLLESEESAHARRPAGQDPEKREREHDLGNASVPFVDCGVQLHG